MIILFKQEERGAIGMTHISSKKIKIQMMQNQKALHNGVVDADKTLDTYKKKIYPLYCLISLPGYMESVSRL